MLRSIRGRRAIPGARAGARDLHFLQSALDADLARDRFRKWTAARVARADEQNLHAIRRLRSGWVRSHAARWLRLPQGESRADGGRCNPRQSKAATASVARRRALAAAHAQWRHPTAKESLPLKWPAEPPDG